MGRNKVEIAKTVAGHMDCYDKDDVTCPACGCRDGWEGVQRGGVKYPGGPDQQIVPAKFKCNACGQRVPHETLHFKRKRMAKRGVILDVDVRNPPTA